MSGYLYRIHFNPISLHQKMNLTHTVDLNIPQVKKILEESIKEYFTDIGADKAKISKIWLSQNCVSTYLKDH